MISEAAQRAAVGARVCAASPPHLTNAARVAAEHPVGVGEALGEGTVGDDAVALGVGQVEKRIDAALVGARVVREQLLLEPEPQHGRMRAAGG